MCDNVYTYTKYTIYEVYYSILLKPFATTIIKCTIYIRMCICT